MPERFGIVVNGESVEVTEGTTVAVALLSAGWVALRRSPAGFPRGPLCGMGICYECRVTINGIENCKSCQYVCLPGMVVRAYER